MKQVYISIHELELLENKISWEIKEKELYAVIGPNNSGKSLLAKIICGQIVNYKGSISKTINFTDVSFSDFTSDSFSFHYSNFYYQQRYNVSEIPDLETIGELLGYDANDTYKNTIFNKILSTDILSKKIIELSSGESRKVLILKNIFKPSKIHILDNPFTGLDNASILILSDVFKIITQEFGKTVILLIPDNNSSIFFDSVLYLNKKLQVPENHINKNIFQKTPEVNFNIAFHISKQHLKVGNKILIRDISWTIFKGEKWLLQGGNGSGKSTLMSLLNADNPMAYAMGIMLFDKERGTGESIWDIKSKIGFVSPEIQLFWDGAQSVKKIIRSGFSNTMILNRRLSEKEEEQYLELLNIFQLQPIENALFASLSSGEKRIVMVARALVNNPPLLILDEPFQGLDQIRFKFLHDFLSAYADEKRTIIQIAHLESERLPNINRKALIENEKLHILI
jgi:molybdate transport system ATP-binding protein